MEKRVLGKTGEKVSIIAFGGIVLMNSDAAAADELVSYSVDEGINYFDIAPGYGNAINLLGPALKPYRDSVFLACKTAYRTKDQADKELVKSLEIMKTDHFDLYQIHAINNLEEVEQVFGPDGVIKTLVQARKKGIVKHLGFSAHSETAALEMVRRFDFDTVMIGINWPCWFGSNFGPRIIKNARGKNLGIIAIKAFAKRNWKDKAERTRCPNCWYCPVESYEEALLGLRFTLSLPVTAAIAPGHPTLLKWACRAAQNFEPVDINTYKELLQENSDFEPIFPQKKG
ncbi:MAG: aldo/keto reductase [Planctomycetota bacterium]